MKANILKDGKLVLRDVDASVTETADLYGLTRWEGRLILLGGQSIDLNKRYCMQLEDGRSGEIIPARIRPGMSQPTVVTFRVSDWQT